MNEQEIVSTIKQLHYANTMLTAVALAYVQDTAAELAPVMKAKGVQIAKGGSAPSSKRTFERIYLEPVGCAEQQSKNPDNGFAVIKVWEWQVNSKWGFNPIGPKALMEFCDSLRDAVLSL